MDYQLKGKFREDGKLGNNFNGFRIRIIIRKR